MRVDSWRAVRDDGRRLTVAVDTASQTGPVSECSLRREPLCPTSSPWSQQEGSPTPAPYLDHATRAVNQQTSLLTTASAAVTDKPKCSSQHLQMPVMISWFLSQNLNSSSLTTDTLYDTRYTVYPHSRSSAVTQRNLLVNQRHRNHCTCMKE